MRPAVGLGLLLAVAIGLALYMGHVTQGADRLSSEAQETPETTPPKVTVPQGDKAFEDVKEGAVRATLEVENRGTMTLELYPKACPKTVAHVTELCRKNFYDGILFHRVVADFVAQAGDPKSKDVKPEDIPTEEAATAKGLGSAGSGTNVPLEAKLPHITNSIGLARSSAPDSGDSQFYINLKDNPDLDGKYCVFGRIVAGADVAKQIKNGDRIKRFSVP